MKALYGRERLGKPGKFELADNGTIFLDEIGEMPLEAQVSLLRLLQNGEVTRVGGKHTRLVNVRVLAATNRNLENAIRQNAFREDLYYRLNVFTLNVPPLRERSSDIALLINHFLDHFVASLGRGPLRVTDRAMDVLLGYPWPGNIRELRNVVSRLLLHSLDGAVTEALVRETLHEWDNISGQTAKPAQPLSLSAPAEIPLQAPSRGNDTDLPSLEENERAIFWRHYASLEVVCLARVVLRPC